MSVRESISVATYNCLADEYLYHWSNHWKQQPNHAQSSYTSNGQQRQKDCTKRVAHIADVICVQELSAKVSNEFTNMMAMNGYKGCYEQFDQKKPDGIAIYYRASKFENSGKEVLSYQDISGRKAIFQNLKTKGGTNIVICNTHIQGGVQNKTVSDLQINTLVNKVNQIGNPVIICGDMNFTPSDSKFQTMQQYFSDSLNGQTTPTSMNGTDGSRLDYIWHTQSATLSSSQVKGDLSKFLSQDEPSDHIPVVAEFSFPITPTNSTITTPTLILQNKFPENSQGPSFRRKVFDAFNKHMQSISCDQLTYGKYANLFEKMIDDAEFVNGKTKAGLLPYLFIEMVLQSQSSSEVTLFFNSISSLLQSAPIIYQNTQLYNKTPSFRWTLFDKFNKTLASELPDHAHFYDALAPQFANLLNEADAQAKQGKGKFIDILTGLIKTKIPNGYAQQLLLSVCAPSQMSTLNQSQTLTSSSAIMSLPPSNVAITVGCELGSGYTLGICSDPSWGNAPIAFTQIINGAWSGKAPIGKDWKFVLLQNGQVVKWENGNNRNCNAQTQTFAVARHWNDFS